LAGADLSDHRVLVALRAVPEKLELEVVSAAFLDGLLPDFEDLAPRRVARGERADFERGRVCLRVTSSGERGDQGSSGKHSALQHRETSRPGYWTTHAAGDSIPYCPARNHSLPCVISGGRGGHGAWRACS